MQPSRKCDLEVLLRSALAIVHETLATRRTVKHITLLQAQLKTSRSEAERPEAEDTTDERHGGLLKVINVCIQL